MGSGPVNLSCSFRSPPMHFSYFVAPCHGWALPDIWGGTSDIWLTSISAQASLWSRNSAIRIDQMTVNLPSVPDIAFLH